MMKLMGIFQRSTYQSSLKAFDECGKAALLIGHAGEVLSINECAATLLEDVKEHLRISNRRLVATRWSDNQLLAALISRAIRTGTSLGRGDRLSVYISRMGKAPLSVEAISSVATVRVISPAAHAILLVDDLEQKPRHDLQRFMAAYKLTHAEAKLCMALLDGHSLRDSAEMLEITEGTARQRLKTIFDKTNTQRQSDLLLTLSRLSLPALRGGSS